MFAIDFGEKAVRVARTLNLIAGDGQTNVLHLNTLAYERWDEVIKVNSKYVIIMVWDTLEIKNRGTNSDVFIFTPQIVSI